MEKIKTNSGAVDQWLSVNIPLIFECRTACELQSIKVFLKDFKLRTMFMIFCWVVFNLSMNF